MLRGRRWLVLVWLAVAIPAAGLAPPDADILVQVRKQGPVILVDVDCPIRAPLAVVWDVLTDYDNMSAFMSTVQSSSVERRVDNVLTVRQTGKATAGPFTFAFENVREVELVPFTEIRSHHISGDLESSTFTTRVTEVDGLLHIINIGRYVPKAWVPPFVGPAVIEGQTRKQFGDIRIEILRRSERRAAGLSPR